MTLTPVRLTEAADAATLINFLSRPNCDTPVKVLSLKDDHTDLWLTNGDALVYYSLVFEEFYIVSALDACQAALDIAEWEHARIVANEEERRKQKQQLADDRTVLALLRARYGPNFEKLE